MSVSRKRDFHNNALKKRVRKSLPGLYRWGCHAKRLGRLLAGRDRLYRYDARPRRLRLGTLYGGWTIAPDWLRRDGVVYSFGVGCNITFDLALIEQFGATVHGFDPAPGVAHLMAGPELPPGYVLHKDGIGGPQLPPAYVFHNNGLGARDGEVEFSASTNSFKPDSRHPESTQIALPVKTLPTILQLLGTERIEVLKLDIEGAEYDQIETLAEYAGIIGQLLIEFHHRLGYAPLRETVRSVNRLREAGFRLFYVSETGAEFSFLGAGM